MFILGRFKNRNRLFSALYLHINKANKLSSPIQNLQFQQRKIQTDFGERLECFYPDFEDQTF
jgi:hypothetical protein